MKDIKKRANRETNYLNYEENQSQDMIDFESSKPC